MWNRSPSPGFKYRPKLKIYTDGKNNKFCPESCTATSYDWWKYVTKYKGKVIFNNYYYSSTTANHQSNCRMLLKQLKIKIDLEVNTHKSLDELELQGNNILEDKYKSLFENEINKSRARSRLPMYLNIEKTLKEEIKSLESLGFKVTKNKLNLLKREVKQNDAHYLMEQRKERQSQTKINSELKTKAKELTPIDLDIFNRQDSLDAISF